MITQELDQDIVEKSDAKYSVAHHVFGFKHVFVNVFMAGNPVPGGKWVLIDAALPGSAKTIKKEAKKLFSENNPPQAIILTHGHFDHVGALPDLLKEWDVPVFAHPLEMPFLNGKSHYPPPDPGVGGGGMAYMSWMLPTRPCNLGNKVHSLPMDGSVPYMPDWRWIHTPGHSPGHISLFRESDRTLLAGDAFTTVNQNSISDIVSQKKEVHGPPAYLTIDWKAAKRSIQEIAALNPYAAGTGHGIPIRGDGLRRELKQLVNDFEDVEVPRNGRYVKQAAITNEEGIVDMPAPVSYNVAKVIAGVSLGAIAGAAIYGLLKKRDHDDLENQY